ncbi:MAG: ATP-grasp domain-containing protein [Candidatus Adiutrix intracellularis]|jgi:hypothetical protein|nr:ATP-grasp domain-containing protein [Candidatus Adiutrix intracellularis]
MSEVLLVGTSFSAAPIYFILKRYGFKVAVCGKYLTDPLCQYADKMYHIDYSKKEDLYKLIKAEKFEFIVPSCNDSAYISASWSADKMAYPGFDRYKITEILHTKIRFRKFIKENKISAPRFHCYKGNNDVEDFKKYPVLVKPDDSFSGRGVSKIFNFSELPEAISIAIEESKSGQAVVEEFIDGSLHSHSAFIQNGRIFLDFFVDEFCTVYPYQVNCSNHPSILSDKIKRKFRETINDLIASLTLCDGLLHTQFITNGKEHWIIECMRRAPGDIYHRLIENSTGVNYMDCYLKPFIGKKITPGSGFKKIKYFARHTISRRKITTPFSFSYKISSENISIVQLKSSGERLAAAPMDKAAILFVEFNDEESLFKITPKLANLIKIQNLEELYG